jgi:hypothetical protein
MNNLERHMEMIINTCIKDFDKTPVETLAVSIEDTVKDLGLDREMYLEDMLRRAERLECYNVCIVVRDLLKK